MIKFAIGLLAMALPLPGVAAEAPAAGPAGKTVVNPEWARRPTGDDMAAVYPRRALARGQSGSAAIRCRVDANGKLKPCRVLAEAPPGWEFGQAALRLAASFKLRAKTAGRSVEGAVVTIPLYFHAPNRSPAPTLNLNAGDAAIHALPLQGAEPAGGSVFACPGPTQPNRKCVARAFVWAVRPDPTVATPIMRKADQRTGVSLLECGAASDGALTGCKVDGATPATEAAIREFAALLRAPKATTDGTPVAGGRIIVQFDWSILAGG
jgi:TonB family protein